jgi:hypothetical protein
MSEFEALLNREYKPATVAVPTPAVATGKRWQVIQEVMGEVEVERELDYTINVCAICGLSDCSCRPRRIIAVKAKVSFPVEMAVATVIVLQ